jgi:hypothetical protein
MESETNYGSHAFMEVAINKMGKQDKRIENIEAFIKKQTDNNAEIKQLVATIGSLKENVHNAGLSVKKMSALSMQIDILLDKLNTAPVQKVEHHHHLPKIIWAAAILMITLCTVCAGWFNTGKKLNSFIANDTKYRAIRLDTAHKSLQQYLDHIDSAYIKSPDMRKTVIQKEKEYQTNFYRIQKALRLKEEAKKLERDAGKK